MSLPSTYLQSPAYFHQKKHHLVIPAEGTSTHNSTSNPRIVFNLPAITGLVCDGSTIKLRCNVNFTGYGTSNNISKSMFDIIESVQLYVNSREVNRSSGNQWGQWSNYVARTVDYKLENALENRLFIGLDETEATRNAMSGKEFILPLSGCHITKYWIVFYQPGVIQFN